MRHPTSVLAALGAGVVLLSWAAVGATRELPASLPTQLTLTLLAGLLWALCLALLPRLRRERGQLALVFALSILARVPAWVSEPKHSDDLYRYLWDGRVQASSVNPYLYPPNAPELVPIRNQDFPRINHPELPTIYPPVAELLFRMRTVVPLSPLAAWKLLVALFDVATLVLLALGLLRLGGDPRRALAWGLCPLVTLELGLNAHADGAGIAFLVLALLAYEAQRPILSGLMLGLAAGVKLLPLVIAPAWRGRRALMACLLALGLASVPYLGARGALLGSLGEYGRRWRSNDGAFALLYAGSRALLRQTRFGGPVDLGRAPRLARLMTGRDRDTIYPDEADNFLARTLSFLLFTAAVGWAFRHRLPPLKTAEVALGAFALLTPALHPWYVLWLLPLVALGASFAWVALAVLAPLGYLPLADYLTGRPWADPIWSRLLLHGVTWGLLVLGLTRDRPPVTSKAL